MTDKLERMNTQYGVFLYLCVFLSGIVPRYIMTFKIPIGAGGISIYTIFVFITWILFVRRIKIPSTIECIYFFIWFIVVICSVWRAEGMGLWVSYVVWIITAILFMQVLLFRQNEKSFEIAIRAIVDVLFVQLLLGLYEVTTHRYLFQIGNISKRLYGNVPITMFHNLNDYATFIVTLLPFPIYMFVNHKKMLQRIYYIFICVVAVFFVLICESRGAYLGLFMILGTLLFLFVKKSQRNKILAFLLILFVVLICVSVPGIRNFISQEAMTILLDNASVSNDNRINLLKNGFYFLKETYGFGVGPGNLHLWLANKSIYPIGLITLIHNWYMEIAATFGVVFFAIYMFFHIRIIVNLVKSFDAKNNFWTKNNTILMSFIAFSIVSISSSSNVYSEWVWMYLVLVAVYSIYIKKAKTYQIQNETLEKIVQENNK